MIGYWHQSVVCPSICHCCALWHSGSGVGGWKLYHCVPRMQLSIHFFRHRYCVVCCSATKYSKQLKANMR